MVLSKTSKDLCKSFAAVTHLAEGLSFEVPIMLKENCRLSCAHTDANSVHGGMAVNFDLENINKK
jgi:hypothetical protein